MATTDTRTGFRLPWSSDRNQDAAASDEAAPTAEEVLEGSMPDDQAAMSSNAQGDPGDPAADADDSDTNAIAPNHAQEPAMIAFDPSPAPAPAAPRKPSKLMVDLGAAIRATAEAARGQALAQVDADVAQVVEAIRNGSREGADGLRVRSDEDIAQIREWSRAEIARIKEETEGRIAARKHNLDEELAAHAAAIEQRVGQVEDTAAAYRASMLAYADSLGSEDDPSRLATLAESMPEPPELDAWADLSDLSLVVEPVEVAPEPDVAPMGEVDAPTAEAIVESDGSADGWAETVEAPVDADEPAEIPFENIVAALGGDLGATQDQPVADEPVAVADDAGQMAHDAGQTADETEPVTAEVTTATPSWGESPELTFGAERPDATADEGDDASATNGATEEPVDRGAILAALEAAAEAVVAAEAAAESADQAEAAADAAETAAEMLKGRADPAGEVEPEGEVDSEAAAAMTARMDAGGFEESFADRLAFLMPSHGEGDADGAPRTTQVIVSGLVSVASIASFKRHLGRLAGVQGVTVASGPAGEFVFNVTHRPDVSFRDAVPTMPGFAARVTNTGDGVIHVTARDPEAEG
jgi:hypothetical protein